MNKRSVVLIIAACLLVALSGMAFASANGEPSDTEEPLRFAFMVHDLGNPFWATQAQGASDMAEELGVRLNIIDLQVDPAKEINTWENLITSDVDGIIISCVDETASMVYCQNAQAAGIKVMAAVHPLDGADGSLSNDEYMYGFLEGVEAGRFIAEELGGEAEFALLAADCTPFVIPRTDGIRDGILSEAPNAVLVSRQDAYQKERGWGRIVNTSSVAAKTGGITAGTAYSTSKGAVSALTFSLAAELAPFGITVNGIAPAYVRTPMVTQQLTEEQRQELLRKIPVRRFCEPEEFAHVVRFLVDDLAGFITGEIIDQNGGLVLD